MLNRLRGRSSAAPVARTRIRGIVALVAAALVLGGILAVPASSAPQKYYTPTISPTCRTANSTSPESLTLTNNMPPGGQGFGSAQIKIPSGWSVPTLNAGNSSFSFANPSTARNWSGTKLNGTTIQLVSSTAADLVMPGGSITFTFPVTAPASGSGTWTTAIKQSNNFLGTGNDFTLKAGATYPVTTVGICNATPVATGPAATQTTDEDTPKTITLTGSDTDNCELTFAATAPLNGTLSAPPVDAACNNGVSPKTDSAQVTYTPDSNSSGSDSFTFTVSDGTSTSAPFPVNITWTAVNDEPVANDDSYPATDGSLSVAAPGVLGNDTDADSDTLKAVLVDGPSHGTLTLFNNGAFSYEPDAGTFGADSFTYRANDGTVNSNLATVALNPPTQTLPCGLSIQMGAVTITNVNPDTTDCPDAVFTASFDGGQLEDLEARRLRDRAAPAPHRRGRLEP